MITLRPCPRWLPAHIGVSQISQINTSQDFADPWWEQAPQNARDERTGLGQWREIRPVAPDEANVRPT